MAGPAAESVGAFRAVLANHDLRRLVLALAGSTTGYWLYSVALGVYAFEEGGATAVGLVYALRMAASAATAPFTAVLADRMSRRRVMLLSDVVRAALLAVVTAAVAADAPLAVVAALVTVIAVVSTAFHPAQAALLPSLARSPVELSAANAASNLIESVAIFAGPAAGALLLAVSDVPTVFAVTALAVASSAVLVARVRPDPAPPAREGAGGIRRQVTAGVTAVLTVGPLRLLFTIILAATVVVGAVNVLVVVLALEELDTGQAGVGLLLAAMGLGGVFGAVPVVGAVARRPAVVSVAANALTGVVVALLGMAGEPLLALALAAAFGATTAASDLAETTLTQRAVPDEVLGRVFGIMLSTVFLGIAAGSALAPLLVDAVGVGGAFAAIGLGLTAVSLALWRPLTSVAQAPVPEERVRLLRSTPVFGPLPEATLEHLARALEPRAVTAGEAVVTQGEPGERFYVVERGELAVEVDGREVERLGAGDFFGEIALLRDVPRTATVAAASDAGLLALGRDEFLAAVTGHPGSAEAADAAAVRRLSRPGLGVG